MQAVFTDVCAHRVLLKDSTAGITVGQVLDELLKKTENPDHRNLFPGMRNR